MIPDFYLELWLAQRVSSPNLQTIFDGVTDVSERCKRMRRAIVDSGIAEAAAGGIKRGRPKTFRQCFESLYGELL